MALIFKKDYDGEGLYDLDQDLIENFSNRYNVDTKDVIFDDDGLLKGKFTVTVKWEAI
ncbi:hypothetical protein M0R04_05020 [Candidatus Dojkabacteria bacterium]|jgi:hypothetical protein|nr:hypothetical protein [Candidatus Dojkabacteria bacterium]